MKLIEDFNATSSLEFLTASRIVIRIWNSRGIVRSISQFLENTVETETERIWGEIEDRVKTIVRSINEIPRLLLEDMEALIIRIGYHIRAMRSFISYSPHLAFVHGEREDNFLRNEITRRTRRELQYPPDFRYSDLEFPVNYWTPYGTVDTKKLDRILALDNRFDLHFRYNLACIDCFEEIIQELFLLLSYKKKMDYLSLGRNIELISYWTHRLMDNMPQFIDLMAHNNLAEDEDVMEEDKDVLLENVEFQRELHFSHSVDEVALKFSLIHGNKAGIEYFRAFLRPGIFNYVLEKTVNSLAIGPPLEIPFGGLLSIRPREHYSDALYFVLSQLSEDKRNEYLMSYGCNMLPRFAMYPFFGLFSKYVNIMASKENPIHTCLLIMKILKLQSVNMYFYGYDLFVDLWHSCSESHKMRAIGLLPPLDPPMRESLMENIRRANEN